jgi:hypothetical protein
MASPPLFSTAQVNKIFEWIRLCFTPAVVIASLGYVPRGRTVYNVSAHTAVEFAEGIDYQYNVDGTYTMTLPTAVGNTNKYTIKNVGAGVVTIATTGGETIDGSTPITLPVTNSSLDIESDDTNWTIS